MMNDYTLEPITIIAGDYFTFEFDVFDKDRSESADLTGYEASILIAPYSQSDATIISKRGSIVEDSRFIAIINSEDTINLTGKFVYQPVLKAPNDRQYRPAQGVLTILPANSEIY